MLLFFIIIWFVASWWLANKILAKLLKLDKTVIKLLAVFLPLFILGPLANVFTAWLKLTDLTIYLSLILSWVSLFVIDRYLLKKTELTQVVEAEKVSLDFFVWSKWYYLVFGLVAVRGFWMIAQLATGSSLASPWEILTSWLILVIASLVVIIGYAIYCRKIPTVATLIMIMVFSLLIHSYLFVYQNGFGGDRFRHLGSEERILQGIEYQPTLQTNNIWYKNLGPLKYPQALTDSAKLSYGTMWSLEVIVAKAFGWPVFQINRFMLPVLWSLFLTLIIFAMSYVLRPDKQLALWSALLANSVYLFQYYGAQGLPASYGLLWLAFYFLLLVGYLKNPGRSRLWLLIAGLGLMYFNYSLAFLLAGIGLLLAVTLVKKKFYIYLIAPLSIVALIGLDYLSSPLVNFSWSKILSSWSFGNFLTFESLSRLIPIIGEWHRLDYALLIVAALIIILGLFKLWHRQDPVELLILLMAKIILASYCLSYWLLNGEHSLTRRLSLFAILFLVLIVAGVVVDGIKSKKSFAVVVAAVVVLTALTYYSGPVLQVNISNREIAKAQAIWHDIKSRPEYCVKDDLNVILALEYVSAKQFQEEINNRNCGR